MTCPQTPYDFARFWHYCKSLANNRCTLVCFDDSNEGFFDLGDVHLQELVGSEGQFFALVDVLDEFVGGQGDDLVHVESQIGRFHLVLDLHEVHLQSLLDLLDVGRHI